ncbi:peptidoglycan-binding protein [Actinoplanes sp. NPDC026623]|uniref:L,D-transpeptidase family protein n=1 Tax=Actinoplanes sp. NPDC026623 TaxID=3155610 RepID=UPI0033F5B0B8
MRRALTFATVVITAATLVAGCDSGGSDRAAAPAPVPSTAPTSAPTTAPPSAEPAPTASAKPKPQKLKNGAKGAEVLALQRRLTELGYWNGEPDGKFGGQTQQAVFALQKAAGLGRDGVVGRKTQKALDNGVRPKAKSTSGRVVEINLKRQLLMLVDDGEVSQVFNTSTGSMEHYEQNGGTFLADTPSGRFRVSRQIDGWRHAPLGLLWRPKYFNGGIAVHGASSVPPYAASHGCARVSISAMNWLWKNDELPLKTRVWVY